MDMQMPVLDGIGATRAIRALPDARRNRIPIIALTADALPELRDEYMASGLDDYQTKPIDWVALDAAILRHLPWAAADAPAAIEPPPVRDSVPGVTPQAMQLTQITQTTQELDEVIAASVDHTPIDADSVGQMRDELGLDVWTAVADIFWPQGDADLAACRAAVVAQDAAARRRAAHSLKGASASLGFASIASLAAVLERCEPGVAVTTLAQLETACSQTRTDWSMATSVAD